ncbi:acyl-CoA thioesterase [Paracoccus onubensis]|uniref:Acyl-CoA thioesterase n=1 Tax=Paracoccus onubensis TaxID=1675788 RepID=A0A418T872_9RHOB|nr:thioesterase family protein [Paracoccus onubensis]RJE89409.1 acyl-CoA thioesterase [Paracoccus onubensis]
MTLRTDITIPDHAFLRDEKILFRHCDPAGIVFYPRYFEMMNDTVEAFFDHIGHPFEQLHHGGAVPTAQLEARFTHPSRHGDRLRFALWLAQLGKASAHLRIVASAGQELRMIFRSVLVLVDAQGRPCPWSGDLRHAFKPYLKNEEE